MTDAKISKIWWANQDYENYIMSFRGPFSDLQRYTGSDLQNQCALNLLSIKYYLK